MVTITGTNVENRLADASERYLRYLRTANRSPHTIRSYAETLHKIAPLGALEALTRADLEAWFDGLWQTMSPASVQHHFKNLRAFLNWCADTGYLNESPMAGMPEPRVKPPVVEPFTPEQVQALFAAARRTRDQALVALLLNTGIRIGELCALRPEDVRSGQLRIRGKGSKQRWVGMSPRTEELVRAQMARTRGETVFAVGRTGAYWALRRLASAAGVPKTHPHRFRDTFAVRFLEAGGGVDDLQVILGHSAITMTLRYVQWGRAQRAIQGQLKYAPSVI